MTQASRPSMALILGVLLLIGAAVAAYFAIFEEGSLAPGRPGLEQAEAGDRIEAELEAELEALERAAD